MILVGFIILIFCFCYFKMNSSKGESEIRNRNQNYKKKDSFVKNTFSSIKDDKLMLVITNKLNNWLKDDIIFPVRTLRGVTMHVPTKQRLQLEAMIKGHNDISYDYIMDYLFEKVKKDKIPIKDSNYKKDESNTNDESYKENNNSYKENDNIDDFDDIEEKANIVNGKDITSYFLINNSPNDKSKSFKTEEELAL